MTAVCDENDMDAYVRSCRVGMDNTLRHSATPFCGAFRFVPHDNTIYDIDHYNESDSDIRKQPLLRASNFSA